MATVTESQSWTEGVGIAGGGRTTPWSVEPYLLTPRKKYPAFARAHSFHHPFPSLPPPRARSSLAMRLLPRTFPVLNGHRLLFAVIVSAALLLAPAVASRGDRLPEFRDCLQVDHHHKPPPPTDPPPAYLLRIFTPRARLPSLTKPT